MSRISITHSEISSQLTREEQPIAAQCFSWKASPGVLIAAESIRKKIANLAWMNAESTWGELLACIPFWKAPWEDVSGLTKMSILNHENPNFYVTPIWIFTKEQVDAILAVDVENLKEQGHTDSPNTSRFEVLATQRRDDLRKIHNLQRAVRIREDDEIYSESQLEDRVEKIMNLEWNDFAREVHDLIIKYYGITPEQWFTEYARKSQIKLIALDTLKRKQS